MVDRSTSIYETTDRLIGEHLELLVVLALPVDDLLRKHEQPVQFVRLMGAAWSLYQQHRIDAKGRCQICTSRGRLRRKRQRPCTVYAALSFYLTQPDELVLRELPEPTVTQQLAPLLDVEQTIRLPRISVW